VIARVPVVGLTLRGLLDRRRTWLMVALAAVPILITALIVAFGRARVRPDFDTMVVQLVLPLIALVFGTAALGSELEEGTIVYLLTKPVRRVRLVAAKIFVAAGLTAALVVPASVLTGFVAQLGGRDLLDLGIDYAIATGLGGIAYATLFLAIGTFTSRALAIGLAYVLLWEGTLADLLEGTRTFSIRQATLGIARGLSGEGQELGTIGMERGLIIIVMFVLVAGALATWRMSRYQLRGGD
jgi:ABC-2 type transport system permease protein